jgi:hypothetical protein
MDLITRDDRKALLEERPGPCLSIHMPTHRGGAEADPIRWKNHIRTAEKLLVEQGMRAPVARELLVPAQRLADEAAFWKYQADGLACFLAPHFLRLYRLPLPLDDLVVAADHFHIKPLLPLLSDRGRFFVLALSQNGVRLLQGTEHRISDVDLTGVPHNLAEALLTHDRDEFLTFHTHPAAGFGYKGAIFSGHGVGIDDAKDNLLHYFQKIDRGLHDILGAERAPLVLAGVDYLLPLYRQASTYPHLVGQGILGNPDHVSNQDLHARAWTLVCPIFEQVEQKAAALYRQLAGTGRTLDELGQILPAAERGEIETLFVATGTECWGRFVPSVGHVDVHDRQLPGDEDLLNRAALSTLAHGGTVFALPTRELPAAPLAAVLRLPLAKHSKRR